MPDTEQRRTRSTDVGWQVVAALEVAVIEYEDGEFRLLGLLPTWFTELVPDRVSFDLLRLFPAVEPYLPEAKAYWSGETPTVAPSHAWKEHSSGSGDLQLQARAARIGDRFFLFIWRREPVPAPSEPTLQLKAEYR